MKMKNDMTRYIDTEALLNELPDDLPYKASVKRVLIQAPAADVVPKSEAENYKKIAERQQALVTEPKRLIKSIPSTIEVSGTRLFLLKHERLAIAEAILAKNIVIEKENENDL